MTAGHVTTRPDTRRGLQLRPAHLDRDAGLMALELAILAPAVIAMLLLVVGFGRVTHARQLVDQAAAASARAASLAPSPAAARSGAEQAAHDTLTGAGLSCRDARVAVDLADYRPGGILTVRVWCTSDLSRLALAGLPGQVTLDAVAASPLEPYRQLAGVP